MTSYYMQEMQERWDRDAQRDKEIDDWNEQARRRMDALGLSQGEKWNILSFSWEDIDIELDRLETLETRNTL